MEKKSRRTFLKTSALAAAAVGTESTLSDTVASPKSIFVHHVYFWLKRAGNEEDRAKLVEGLEKLAKVKTIQMAHIGFPADTNRPVIDRSYAVSWLCFFKNDVDQASYQVDPIHLKFVEDCKHLWEKVIVYDSEGRKR